MNSAYQEEFHFQDYVLLNHLENNPEKIRRPKSLNELKEGRDYYFENGLMVFTEIYHLEKGYCCKNDCRHCPYDKEN